MESSISILTAFPFRGEITWLGLAWEGAPAIHRPENPN